MTTTHKHTPAAFSSLEAGAGRGNAPLERNPGQQYLARVITPEMTIAERLQKAAASGALAAAVSADEIPVIVAALESKA